MPFLTPRPHSGALLRYVAGWLGAGAVVALTALAALKLGSDDDISLPAIKETQLAEAARASRCELREEGRGQRLQPPVVGPRAAAARPGAYSEPLEAGALIGAMRLGTIVIHYRRPVAGDRVEQLEQLQKAVPTGTIVTPNEAMPYALAVTGWRRLLGCRRFNEKTIDAIRLFRGRYIGSGPDR